MREIHFIPENDEREHELDILCSCSPNLEYPNDNITFVVHRPADKRDLIENLAEELAIELNYDGWEIWVSEEI